MEAQASMQGAVAEDSPLRDQDQKHLALQACTHALVVVQLVVMACRQAAAWGAVAGVPYCQ